MVETFMGGAENWGKWTKCFASGVDQWERKDGSKHQNVTTTKKQWREKGVGMKR